MEFFSFQKSYAKLLSFIIFTLRALDIFCFRLVMLLLLLYFKGIFLQAIKVILPKIVFDFTEDRLSKNVKILPRGSMTFVCNKGTQGSGLQKRNIYHICIFDH